MEFATTFLGEKIKSEIEVKYNIYYAPTPAHG